MTCTIFDDPSAHLQKVKNRKLVIIGFPLIVMDNPVLQIIQNNSKTLLMAILISWPSFMTKWFTDQKCFQKCTLTWVLILMTSQFSNLMQWFKMLKIKYLKRIKHDFPWNEKIVKLCYKVYIFRSYVFFSECNL